MSFWAAVVALAIAALGLIAGDPDVLLSGLGEIALVLTLFTLVCAAEALN